MKRIFCTLFALMFAVNVYAVNAPLTTRSDIRTAVLNQMEHATAGTAILSTTVVNEVINRAQLKVAYDFPAVEKLDTVTLNSVATPMYALPNDFLKLNFAIKVLGDTIMAIEYVPPQTLYNREGGRTANISDNSQFSYPRYCFISKITNGGNVLPRIWFFPQAKSVGSPDVIVSYFAVPEELNADTDTTEIAYEYREALVYWACSALAFRIGRHDMGMVYLLSLIHI